MRLDRTLRITRQQQRASAVSDAEDERIVIMWRASGGSVRREYLYLRSAEIELTARAQCDDFDAARYCVVPQNGPRLILGGVRGYPELARPVVVDQSPKPAQMILV